MNHHQRAFTLVEIAISIAVLFVGLAGTLSLYLLGMRWANEIKVNLTAFEVAEAVLRHPSLLPDIDAPASPTPAAPAASDEDVAGWYMGYYVTRHFDSAAATAIDDGDVWVPVRVVVYHGGDDTSGQPVVDLTTPLLVED